MTIHKPWTLLLQKYPACHSTYPVAKAPATVKVPSIPSYLPCDLSLHEDEDEDEECWDDGSKHEGQIHGLLHTHWIDEPASFGVVCHIETIRHI